jgi:hypothetical protein
VHLGVLKGYVHGILRVWTEGTLPTPNTFAIITLIDPMIHSYKQHMSPIQQEFVERLGLSMSGNRKRSNSCASRMFITYVPITKLSAVEFFFAHHFSCCGIVLIEKKKNRPASFQSKLWLHFDWNDRKNDPKQCVPSCYADGGWLDVTLISSIFKILPVFKLVLSEIWIFKSHLVCTRLCKRVLWAGITSANECPEQGLLHCALSRYYFS